MVGNPPFIGGQKITGAAGTDYRNHLVTWIATGTYGSADIVAYFFLNAFQLTRSFGYLATNTIAQGSTSRVGLSRLIDASWTIYRAVSSVRWPGQTALEIAKCWISKDNWRGQSILDGRIVNGIDEMLYPTSRSDWRKQRLVYNANRSFQGSITLGDGFIVSSDEAQALIEMDPRNTNILFPYLGGDDLNKSPNQQASRWVINFFDWPKSMASQYPDCFAIIERRVRPERLRQNDARAQKFWWQHLRPRPHLYNTIKGRERVIAISQVSKPVVPVLVPTGQIFQSALIIFPYDDDFHLGVLSSGFHFRWAVRHASSLETRTRYTPSDVFETFVQPPYSDAVSDAAQSLDEFRRDLMTSEWIGLTTLYNRIHDSTNRDRDIRQMRALHRNLDHAVQAAYGWDDLNLDHGFHNVRGAGVRYTFAPETADEILDRLLELNRDRYQAEVAAGLHQNKASPARAELGGLFAPSEDPPQPTPTDPDPEGLA